MAHPLNAFVAVPISTELFARLLNRYPKGVSAVVEDVMQDFLDRTAEDFDGSSSARGGIRWESLFLPDGTQIRTKYFGKFQIAKVEKESILWEGKRHASLSQLARAMRGDTSNNAWKVLEIKRPNDFAWILADRLR
jgi:hypothetical protein